MAIDKNKAIANAQRYTQKGQLDRALKEYQAIVAEDSEDVRIWLKIGDLFTKKGAVSQAVSTYARVALYYSDRGFFLKAVAVWKQILNIDPGYTEAHLKLAELYVQLGLAPDSIGQYQIVVGAYEREGRHRDSLTLLKKIVELAPDDIPNRIRLAEAFARQNENPKAVDEFKVILEQLHQKERWDEAIQVGERVAYLAPEDIENLRLVSEVYLRRGDARRALARLQACFKASPTDVQTLDLLARAFTELGQIPKAISVHRELARLHEEGENPAARLEAFRRILALDPTDVEAISVTGGGRTRDAQKPLPSQVLFTQGITNSQGGMQRLGAIAQPVELLSPEDQVRRHFGDVDLLLKYGLGEHALQTTDKILALETENEPALLKRKDIALAIGRRDEAISTLLRLATLAESRSADAAMAILGEALQISPHHNEAGQRMQRLSSGMAAGLRRNAATGPQPAVIEAAPSDDYPDLDLGALDFGDEGTMDPLRSPRAPADMGDLEVDLDDLDEPAPIAQEPAELSGLDDDGEDDFGGLLDAADDEFQDLLSVEDHLPKPPASLSAERSEDDFGELLSDAGGGHSAERTPRPPSPDDPADDDFGGLLVGPRLSNPASPTPASGMPIHTGAAPTPVKGMPAFSGLSGAPTPQPLADDFGDLGQLDAQDDDFSDLLSDEDGPGDVSIESGPPAGASVSVEAADDAEAGLSEESDFGDLLGGDEPLAPSEATNPPPVQGGDSTGAFAFIPEASDEAPAGLDAEALLPETGAFVLGDDEPTNYNFAELLPDDLQGALDAADAADAGASIDVDPEADPDVESMALPVMPAFEPEPEPEPEVDVLAGADPDDSFDLPAHTEAVDISTPGDSSDGLVDFDLPGESAGGASAEVAPETPGFPAPDESGGFDDEGDDDGHEDRTVALNLEALAAPPVPALVSLPSPPPAPVVRSAVDDAFSDLLDDGGGDEGDDEDADRTVFAAPEPLPTASQPATRPMPFVVETPSPDLPSVPSLAPFRPSKTPEPAELEAEVGSLPGVDLGFSVADELDPLEDLDAIEMLDDEDMLEDDSDEPLVMQPSADVVPIDDDDEVPIRPRRPMIDSRTVVASVSYPDIEEDLAEVDFLIESGLGADARDAVEDLASAHGIGHPSIQARLARIGELESQSRDAESALTEMSVNEAMPLGSVTGSEVGDLADADVAAHFDLGVAYMEMGQYKKAIAQLQKVAAVRERRAEALRVIALCELQQGNAPSAVRNLEEALAVPGVPRDGRVGLLYDLASAYEAIGNKLAARTQLKAIIDLGAGEFLDVRERLARLSGA